MNRFRLLALGLLLGVVLTAEAQVSHPPIRQGTADPATCNPGAGSPYQKLFYRTDLSAWRFCSGINTWTTIGSSTGCTVAGATGDIQYNNGVGGCTAEAAFNYNATTNTLTVDNITATGGTVNAGTLQQSGVAAVTVSGTQTLTGKTLTTPIIGAFIVAGLPAAGTANRVAIVTDALTAGSCTSGGGSARAWCRDTGAAWEPLGDGGAAGGAPVGATYITQTADGTLTNEQALAALATGIMRVATTTGVVTSLTDSAGIAANISDEIGTGALVFGSSPTLTTPTISGAISFPDGVRQTFNPNATTPGFNPGSQAGDPLTPINGDLWYDSTGNALRARINGATVSLGAAGSGCTVSGSNNQVVTDNGASGCVSEANLTFDGNVLTAIQDAASTNTVLFNYVMRRTSSGTPAAGIGVGQQFEVETAAGNNEIGATIEAETTDVTATSEDFDLVIRTMAAGAAAAERARFKSTGEMTVGTAGTAGAIQPTTGACPAGVASTSTFCSDTGDVPSYRKGTGSAIPIVGTTDTQTLTNKTLTTPTLSNQSLNQTAVTVRIANEGVTGTTLNKLAKLAGAPSTAIITGAADTAGAVGVVVSGAGTTGNAEVSVSGVASCVFDGATTAGNFVGLSGVTAGNCKDIGSAYPTNGIQVLGRVLSTNVAAGTYAALLFPPDIRDSQGAGGSGDNITVNGVAATDADFDDATPAAPANAVNIKWQKDALTPNNISAYLVPDFGAATSLIVPKAAGAAPTADGDLRYDTTNSTFKGGGAGAVTGSFPRVLSMSTPNESKTNSVTTDQDYAVVFTIPANYLIDGRCLRVTLSFNMVTGTSTANFIRYLKLGSTKVLTGANTDIPNGLSRSSGFLIFVCGTAAAGASVNVQTFVSFGAGSTTDALGGNFTTQPIALATNGTLTIVPGVNWSATGSTETSELMQVIIEELVAP